MGTFVYEMDPNEVDVVIAALRPDLSFLEAWRPMLEPFHLIVVQANDLDVALQVPPGFDADVYTPTDIKRLLGAKLSALLSFKGNSCKCFGYLVSKKPYIYTFDDDCVPAQNPKGLAIHPIEEHVTNLKNPSTPYFFNTLYDPYRESTDFVRGYPFSLREGVETAISHGLWLNVPDYDAPTLTSKPHERNDTFVDAVITVPKNSLFPMSGINLAFNRKLIGPAMFSGQVELGSGESASWDTLDDIWAGLCSKVICDVFGYGVKTGLPYVWRNQTGDALAPVRNEIGHKEIFPFFQSLQISENALDVEDSYLEVAKQVKKKLGAVDPLFKELATSMEAWIEAWREFNP